MTIYRILVQLGLAPDDILDTAALEVYCSRSRSCSLAIGICGILLAVESQGTQYRMAYRAPLEFGMLSASPEEILQAFIAVREIAMARGLWNCDERRGE